MLVCSRVASCETLTHAAGEKLKSFAARLHIRLLELCIPPVAPNLDGSCRNGRDCVPLVCGHPLCSLGTGGLSSPQPPDTATREWRRPYFTLCLSLLLPCQRPGAPR